MDQKEKDRLVDTPVTLNHRPAKICGRLEDWACVRYNDDPRHQGYIYSWPTIRAIVDYYNGEFVVDGVKKSQQPERDHAPCPKN